MRIGSGCGRLRGEAGMTTAEYAGCAGGVALVAGGLLALVEAGWFTGLFARIFDAAMTWTLPDLLGSLL